MLGVTSGSELFWKGGIKLQKKEMSCEFRLNYLSMKIPWKRRLKNQLSIYPEITWNYPKKTFIIKKLKTCM